MIRVVGWASAMDRWGDYLGICHLLVADEFEGSWVARPACGTTVRLSGQVHKEPPDYTPHTCLNCKRTRVAKKYEAKL